MCPSFAFGTYDARGPCVLALPLGPMAHAVRVSLLHFWDRWRTRSVCSTFPFGTDGACRLCVIASPLGLMVHAVPFLRPNEGMVRKPNITITRSKITS